MLNKIKFFIFVVITLTYLCACQKQEIIAPPPIQFDMPGTSGGTAVFSLAAKNNCINTNASGIYNKGTALNTTNTVLINVTVDTIGTYTIATANIYGVVFKASGIFTSVGAQTISLQGFGTPLSTGSYNFIPGADGCKFPITFSSNGSLAKDAVFALMGSPDSCISTLVMGEYKKGIALNNTDSIVLKVNVGKPGTYSINTNANNGVIFLANGTFTGTGVTSVTMFGIGTPAFAGTFNFIPGSNGCFFTISVK